MEILWATAVEIFRIIGKLVCKLLFRGREADSNEEFYTVVGFAVAITILIIIYVIVFLF